jgi:hypothetical protein
MSIWTRSWLASRVERNAGSACCVPTAFTSRSAVIA